MDYAMEYAPLGRTGINVSRICLGTALLGFAPLDADVPALVDRALDLGINFFDTGLIAGQVLPTLQYRYEVTLTDIRNTNRQGEVVLGVQIADLTDANREAYRHLFTGQDAVVHFGFVHQRMIPMMRVSALSMATSAWLTMCTRQYWKKVLSEWWSPVLIMPLITMNR